MIQVPDEHKEVAEIISFQLSYSKKRIKATWALCIVIVALFLLEELFGGSNSTPVLVRMGANVKSLVHEGEYFRLMSSVFLHGGYLHVFFNTYVLFALGGFFNRILGETKYLSIFFISGIFGSLSSIYFGKADISVGASGAIWGLFGASLALAFFKTRLIPEPIRLRLRKMTFINLAINLGVSFLPMVDIWAHLGGCLGGFLCSLLMIFNNDNKTIETIKNRFFQLVAIALFLIYAGSIAMVFMQYRPWSNQLTADLVEQSLGTLPFTIKIPSNLPVKESEERISHTVFQFGNLNVDQLVVELQFFPDASLDEAKAQTWLSDQQKRLLQDPKAGNDLKRSLDLRTTPKGPELFYKIEPEGSFVAYSYAFIRAGYAVKLVFVTAASTKQAAIESLARSIIDSLQRK